MKGGTKMELQRELSYGQPDGSPFFLSVAFYLEGAAHMEVVQPTWQISRFTFTLPTDHLIQDEIQTCVCCIGLSSTQNYNFELRWNFNSFNSKL